MAEVLKLTYNDFQENTFIVYDETKECIIFDPGCFRKGEKENLTEQITKLGLKPVRLINTHCHLDHVFGNAFVAETYNLGLEVHKGELPLLTAYPEICEYYGIVGADISPQPEKFINEGDIIRFGNTELLALFTPGHSPASLCFYCKKDAFIIAGDVLFYESIGRSDLPGGDYNTLIKSIKTQLLPLGDHIKVYPGHGPATTIGHERSNNQFLV